MVPRVGIAAHHQDNTVLRILLGEEKCEAWNNGMMEKKRSTQYSNIPLIQFFQHGHFVAIREFDAFEAVRPDFMGKNALIHYLEL